MWFTEIKSARPPMHDIYARKVHLKQAPSVQGCIHSVSQEEWPASGETPIGSTTVFTPDQARV